MKNLTERILFFPEYKGDSGTAVISNPAKEIDLENLQKTAESLQTKHRELIPQRKSIQKETLHSRVIVVSPYGQLNAFFESEIPKIIDGGYTDIISEAEINELPYIDVARREKTLPKPFWIIDFQKIIAEQPNPKYNLDSLLTAFREKLLQYSSSEKVNKIFREALEQETSLEKRIKNIITKLRKDLKTTLKEVLQQELKETWQRVAKEHPVTKVVKFDSYKSWSNRINADYITPKHSFSKTLEEKHIYDEKGNFLPNKLEIAEYTHGLSSDLKRIAEKITDSPTLYLQKNI